MAQAPHRAHVVHTFEQYLDYLTTYRNVVPPEKYEPTPQEMRRFKRTWKKHIEKNGNVPMILQCPICSGQELKEDIKRGKYVPRRKDKVLRDEEKGE